MKKVLFWFLLFSVSYSLRAQYNFEAVTQLLTDSIGVIGMQGQDAGFVIIRGDSIIYKQYWGSWDDNTYQPIASGTKMASMALLMRLIDQGYLSPGDTIQNFLPSFSSKHYITLHQLMSHTSGLPGLSPYLSNNNITLAQAVDLIGLNTQMSVPGTQFFYGGVGMQVAGRMAEIVTGTPWDVLFQQKIAAPLGMTNTDYLGFGNTTNFRIGGAMGTTLPDFSRFLQMLLNYGKFNGQQIIDSTTVRMMQRDQTNALPIVYTPYEGDTLREHFRYGYGVWIEENLNDHTTQFGSQGAFGFTPWIDRCRNIACILFVRRSAGMIQPTHTALRKLVEQIIPLAIEQPVITEEQNKLRSSYTHGNQWYLNGSLLEGETGQYLTPPENGIYSVKYTNEDGCEVFSGDYSYMITNIHVINDTPDLIIFPNPASNILNITSASATTLTVQILDLSGREMINKKISGNTGLDISGLSPQVYIIRITDDKSYIMNFRFLKLKK
jgi:CubicO group peptidase (beta-lactamase class C family)